MKRLFRKLKDRKGITMTEVIVAMAVVVIITGAAISLLVASVRFDNKYNAQTRALNACESAAQCLRFAEDDTKLGDYLELLGFEWDTEEGCYFLSNSGRAVEVRREERGWAVIFNNQVIYEYNK